nr:hypothetical protein BaRGS_009055 [Batillaria attramentaria]
MQNKGVQIGTNIGGIEYFSSEIKWVDIFKQSSEWITQREGRSDWDTKEQDSIHWRADANQRLVKLMMRGFGEHDEGGRYTLLYDGEGTVDFSLAQHTVRYNGKGRMIVEFPQIPHSGIAFRLLATNPSDPIRNVRLLPPGYENTYERFPFHPLFLEFLKRFSEIRFMDFLRTNGHTPEPTTWNDRKPTNFHTQVGHDGGSIEYLVQLANTVGADPWVYVEYSNEVWNGIFRQTRYTQEQGKHLFPNDPGFKQGMKYFNKRATEVANIWTQAWGSQKSRITNVYAWQTGYQDYYRQALEDLGNRKSSFQALAITGYFDCDKAADDHASELPHMSMTQIQHLCDIDLPNQKAAFTHYMNVAKSHGLKLVMYEGGPSVMENQALKNGGSDEAVTNKAIAFNMDPAIQRPVHDVLEAWYSIVTSNSANHSPGGLFNYFSSVGTPSKYGSWGMAQYTGQDLSKVPKWLAVQAYITHHWGSNPLGPKCSFVKDTKTSTAYGCFQSGGHYVCAKSANNGGSWTNLPSLHQGNNDHLTLDGFDPTHKKLYVRVTNHNDVITYHVYSEQNHHWTTYVQSESASSRDEPYH